MADVALYFPPFPGANAVGLEVEESPNESGPWTPILDTDEIGEFPNWITSIVVSATTIDAWFRIRWQLGPTLFSDWSDPVWGPALPYHWTVPDLYRSVTRLRLEGWTNPQLQIVIDRAYYLIQSECGPFDETDPEFADIAQLVIHSVMDQLLPALSSGVLVGSGMKSETMGSYSYDRFADSLAAFTAAFMVPMDLVALICPYGQRDHLVSVESTEVFSQTPYTLAGSQGRTKIFTSEDRTSLAPQGIRYPWWPKWGTH